MNPFNQSRYRNEHTLGDSYKIVKEVHDKLDIVKMVADNISNFRSGNIELKGEGALIYWKYTEGTEWFLLMDTADVFSPLLQSIADIEEDIVTLSSDISGNSTEITAINAELIDIKASITALEGVVSEQATTISGLSDQLGTLQGTVTTQGISITGITSRIEALESV